MVLDLALARAAFRTRAEALVVATTGSATLSATLTGYARASGSFITDGFVVGQDVTPSGFTLSGVANAGLITKVEALLLTIDGGRTAQTSGSGRSLVSGIPTMRAYQNAGTFTPIARRPYIVEGLPGGGSKVQTIPGRTGRFQQDGILVWTWAGVAGTGTSAIDKGMTALMARFSPFTRLPLSDGTDIDMLWSPGPTIGDLVNMDGFARRTVQLPWRASTRNAVLV